MRDVDNFRTLYEISEDTDVMAFQAEINFDAMREDKYVGIGTTVNK